MRKIIFITLVIFLQSLNADSIVPLQIIKVSPVSEGVFRSEFTIPENSGIKILVPNTQEFITNNITIELPDGTIVNSSNATTYDFNFTQFNPTNEIEALYAPYPAWVIETDSPIPSGKLFVVGEHATHLEVPISLYINGSNIYFKMFIGEPERQITTNRPIPFTLYLNEDSSYLTNATVTYELYQDINLMDTVTLQDNGVAPDLDALDGHYDHYYSFNQAGKYRLITTFTGKNNSGQPFEGRIISTFNVVNKHIQISSNYAESTTDDDQDGFKDSLVLTFPFDGVLDANDYFYVYAKLNAGDTYVDSHVKINASENLLYVTFDGKELRETGYSGTFSPELVRFDLNGKYYDSFKDLNETQYYDNNEWERDDLIYKLNFREEPIDVDNNKVYEGLNFFFDVDTIFAGNFGYSLGVEGDDDSDMGLLGNNQIELVAGFNTIETQMPATYFSDLGIDSQILVKNLLMYGKDGNDGFLRLKEIGLTKKYSCWDFAGCENGPNTPPEAIDDVGVSNGSSIYINAASNDIDADGDLIKVNSVTQPQNGVAEIVGNAVQYTPNEGFTGDDIFTYEILDVYPKNNVWKRGSDIGTITVSVANNLPPVANDDTYAIPVNGEAQLAVLENDSDPDGDNLYITETTAPQSGTVTNYGNIIVYKANDGFEGQDSFEYTIIDVDPETNIAKDGTDSAVVTLNVGAVSNSPPVANDDEYTVNAGVQTTLDIVANDSDPDGDSVYVVEYSLPTEGILEFVNNKAVYTAYADSTGFDGFKYTITDTKGGYSQANVLINIVNDNINSPPVANDDYASTLTNTPVTIPVLENDTDPENDTLSIVSVSPPSNGDAAINNGQVEYTPALDFTGEDIFSYTVTDGNGNESTASVFVAVNPTNSPPIAHDDSAITQVNQSVSIDVLSNDEDPDNDTLTIISIAAPSSGTAEASGNNIIYTPDTDYVGNDSFTYTISDGRAVSTATVAIVVEDTNAAPVAQDDSASVIQGGMITLDVLQNDSDPNGDVLNIIAVTQPDYGEAAIENNKIKYVSDSSYVGEVSFSYTISDGVLTANANIVINVEEKIDTAPSIQILAPEDGDNYTSNINIILMAEAIDNEDGLLENILWESSIDGALGSGSEITVNLSPGQHLITASVTDSSDNSSSSTVNITVSQSSGTEYRNDNDYNIPDNKGYGVSSNINIVNSLLTHRIEVRASISHASESDIAVQLIAPSGKHYNLSNPGSYNRDEIWSIEFKNEIDIKGTWTLKVSDQKLNVTGSLLSWSITVE